MGSERGQQQPLLNGLCSAMNRKSERCAMPPGTTALLPHIFLKDRGSGMTARIESRTEAAHGWGPEKSDPEGRFGLWCRTF